MTKPRLSWEGISRYGVLPFCLILTLTPLAFAQPSSLLDQLMTRRQSGHAEPTPQPPTQAPAKATAAAPKPAPAAAPEPVRIPERQPTPDPNAPAAAAILLPAALKQADGGQATPLVKVQRPTQATDKQESSVVLRFENAEIQDIAQAILGDMLHINYLIDPSIQARITLQTTGNISAADVFSLLESVLALHGISIVRDGQIYKIIRDIQATREATNIAAGSNSPVIQIIPLKFIQASTLVATLKGVAGPQALVTNDPTNRYLIVVDRAQSISKILEIIATLDVDYLSKVRIRLVDITKADVTELTREIDTLFRTSGMFNWPGTDANKVHFVPITRMNAILVAAASDEILATAEKWIRTLDGDAKGGMGDLVHIYPVAHSNATHLANLLRQLYGGAASPQSSANTSAMTSATPATSPSSILGGGTAQQPQVEPNRVVVRGAAPTGVTLGNVQIIADEATNSLVIRASPQDYQQIRRIIERIDAAPRQVLIQVMVAEVALTDQLQYGVEWWLRNLKFGAGNARNRAEASLQVGLAPPTPGLNPITAPTTGVASSGLNYLLFNSAGDVTGLFNLLATNTDVNILSAPHVLASDGKTAKIEVGSEEPVVTQTVATPTGIAQGTTTTFSSTVSNSIQYRPTGILMEVTPSINDSGLISLKLTQEVSSRGIDVQAGGPLYPSFTKRKISTDVTIEDGKTLVVAGLIQSKGDNSDQGIPWFKDLPVLGVLFGNHKRNSNKTELLVTITPFIVRSKEDGEELTRTLRESLGRLNKLLGESPSIGPSRRVSQ